MDSVTFPIGELARYAGTNAETIRYYDRIGLLAKPGRTSGNYRAYERTHLDRLSFIRRSRELGFSLEQIRALLDLSDRRDQPCEAADTIAQTHLDEIESKIADLVALRQELQGLVANCCEKTIAKCRIIEALSPRAQA